MDLDDLVVQIKRDYFSSIFHTFDLNICLYKEVTSFVCTFVAILTTVIRLSVRRWQFGFDDVRRVPLISKILPH